MDEPHSYHCDCSDCDFDSEWDYRIQRDSSCGGEVISGVMHYGYDDDNTDRWTTAMNTLENLSVDVDAEPGLRAGFHVHVGSPPATTKHCAETYWAYLRWEDVLGDLTAAGRFNAIREFNHRIRDDLRWWNGYDGATGANHLPQSAPWVEDPECSFMDPLWVEEHGFTDEAARSSIMVSAWRYGTCLDRHGWLNLRTRGQHTWEFRMFNSTRAAWRMEMYARTALLMVHGPAVEDLLTITPDPASLIVIANKHDPGLGDLMERQRDSQRSNGPFQWLLPSGDDPTATPANVDIDVPTVQGAAQDDPALSSWGLTTSGRTYFVANDDFAGASASARIRLLDEELPGDW